MNPSTLTINNSLKSIGLMQNTSPLLNKPLPHSTIKLPRIKIFISGFKNYQFCQNSGNVANDRGWGVILFALSWRIAYKNRYMTRTSVFLQHREIITVLAITLDKLNITFFMKILKSRKKKMALSSFFVSIKKYEWVIHDQFHRPIKILQFPTRGAIQKQKIQGPKQKIPRFLAAGRDFFSMMLKGYFNCNIYLHYSTDIKKILF